MSRAHWVAFGSTLALMSCNDSGSKPAAIMDANADMTPADGAVDAGVGHDAEKDDVASPPLDGSSDAGAIDDVRVASDAPDAIDATQDTGDVLADVAFDTNGDVVGDAPADVTDAREAGPDAAFFACCRSDFCNFCDRRIQICDLTTIPNGLGNACLSFDGGTLGGFPQACMPEPNCACMRPFYAGCGVGPSSTWYCSEDAGAVILSCNGCYGAPPARLERLRPRDHALLVDVSAVAPLDADV